MRHEELYLSDALKALGELRQYLVSAKEEAFLSDPMRQSFVFTVS